MSAARTNVVLQVNDRRVTCHATPNDTLLDVLRESGLTGTKEGCSVGECGSCTVLVDGVPTPSCLVLAAEVAAARVTTIETTSDRRIGRMRRAFIASEAFQCGACTPGMIITASRIPENASPEAIRSALAGNICRCTGYASIVRAVQSAWEAER